MTLTELRTPRLLLRAWREDDREPFAALNADPRVMRWFPSVWDRARSDAAIDRFTQVHHEHGYTAWAVEVRESARGPAQFVGVTGLVPPIFTPPFAHTTPCVEVVWRLDPEWWGMGIATEAAHAALHHGLHHLELPEIVSFTVPANLASQAVMQRLGMHYDGVFNHPAALDHEWWAPHVLYRATSAG